jgi:hypothetical protein
MDPPLWFLVVVAVVALVVVVLSSRVRTEVVGLFIPFAIRYSRKAFLTS